MEQELAQANANLPSGNAPTQRVINWGGVLKGVAIVAAVVVVGVVAFSAFTALAGYATSAIAISPAASSVAVGVGNAATWAGESLLYGINYIGGALGYLGNSALGSLGLAGTQWGGAAATTHVIGVAGATAATAVAAHAAMPTIHGLQLGADVPVDAPPSNDYALDNGLLATQGAQNSHIATHASALHEVTHAAHHAAETNNEHAEKSWSQKFANKATFASHSDAVRATQAAKAIPQPAASFGEQLNADRANLDAALAK
jgi:hypothetical protein